MLRFLILLIVMSGCSECFAQKTRSVNKVKKEQRAAEQKIKENNKKLNDNNKETQRNLNELNVLKSELKQKSQEISSVKANIDSLNAGIRTASDSLTRLNETLSKLQATYVDALRLLQGTQPMMDYLGFVFSSESFSKAYARMRYMTEFSRWRQRRVNEIMRAQQMVGNQRDYLDSLNVEKRGSLVELNKKEQELKEKQRQTNNVVKKLRKERKSLQAAIANQKKQMQQLENELIRLEREAQERKKKEAEAKNSGNKASGQNKKTEQQSATSAADRKITGGFEANRGNLLLPVAGKYTVVRQFGSIRHPEIDNIETKNTGVDLLVSPGTKARCIYDGEVSAVMWQSSNMATVLIRHGDYRSVYQYVSNPTVKTGDKVKTNQVIGTVSPNLDYSKRTVIHFEIRKGTSPLDPLKWAK